MASSVPISAGFAKPLNTHERLFDHGCALFFEAVVDQPLLDLALLIAMHPGSTELVSGPRPIPAERPESF